MRTHLALLTACLVFFLVSYINATTVTLTSGREVACDWIEVDIGAGKLVAHIAASKTTLPLSGIRQISTGSEKAILDTLKVNKEMLSVKNMECQDLRDSLTSATARITELEKRTQLADLQKEDALSRAMAADNERLQSTKEPIRQGSAIVVKPKIAPSNKILIPMPAFSIPARSGTQKQEQKPKQTISLGGELWDEIDKIYSLESRYTEMQKKELWPQYKDRYIEWTGIVSYVNESFMGLSVGLRMRSSTMTYDVLFSMKKEERDNALQLVENDIAVCRGKLDNWGSLMPISLSEGEIVSIIHR